MPPQIPLDEWSRIGHKIFVISESSTWWLGDWLIYGQSHYPDRYLHAVAETSLDYQTLRNYAWVARRYPASRRRAGLSFQHHAELASLPEDQQDKWLDRAEKFGWSRNELRNRLKASRNASPIEGAEGEAVQSLEVNVPADQKRLWAEAASTTKQDLVSWIMDILDDAAASTPRLTQGEHRDPTAEDRARRN
ncbi:hypothetical protein EWH70_25195 [Amycolatopsis suaedae]|uniref:LmbU n=1 Tax=Amycolatopsis suaedae TaxID=2510978 RepID=A0A4V2ELE7_9PSEU|nr:hypothetical protein EWH70_25195 [Amycolatopsis suaedae]